MATAVSSLGGGRAAGGGKASAAAAEDAAISEGSSSMELTDTDEAAFFAAHGREGTAAAGPTVAAGEAPCPPAPESGRHHDRRSHKKKSGSWSSGRDDRGVPEGRRRGRSRSGSRRAASGAATAEGSSSSSDASGSNLEQRQHGSSVVAARGGDRAAAAAGGGGGGRKEAHGSRRTEQEKRRRGRHSAGAAEEETPQQQQPRAHDDGLLRMRENCREYLGVEEAGEEEEQRRSGKELRRRGERGEREGEGEQVRRNVGKDKTHKTRKRRRRSSSSNCESSGKSPKEAADNSSSPAFSSCPPAPPWRKCTSKRNESQSGAGGGTPAGISPKKAKKRSSSTSDDARSGSSTRSLRARRVSSSSDSSMSYSSGESNRGRRDSGGQHSEGGGGHRTDDSSRSRSRSGRSRSRSSDSSTRPDMTAGSDGSRSSKRSRGRRQPSSSSTTGGGESSSDHSRRRTGSSGKRKKQRSSSGKGRKGERDRGEQQDTAGTAAAGAASAGDLEMQLLALQQEIAEANRQRIQQQEAALKAFLAQPDSSGPPPCGAVHARSDEETASKAGDNSENGEEDSDPEFNADDLVGERIEILESQQVTVELVESAKGFASAPQQQQEKLPLAIQTVEDGQKCLHPSILSNLRRCGFKRLMPVQKFAFPIAAAGFDICGMAQTGSGKTLAFVAPLLSQLLRVGSVFRPFFPGSRAQASPLGLILVPTRELALQIGEEIERMTRQTQLHHVVLAGGCAAKEQAALINQQQVDVAVCTPGRLEDLCDMCKVCLEFVQILVLDEADAMLDLGFRDKIVALVNDRDMPKERQTLLFSATYAEELMSLIPTFLRSSYVRLTVGPPADAAALQTGGGNALQGPAVKQILKLVGSEAKLAELLDDLEKFLKTQKIAALAHNNVTSVAAPPPAPAQANTVPGNAASSVSGGAGVAATIAGVLGVGTGAGAPTVGGSGAAGTGTKTSSAPSVPGVNFQQQQVIVFVNSKRDVFPTVHALRLRGISVDGLSGSMSREARRQVYHDFKARRFQIMVATSLAARGLDFLDVSLVINYDVPTQAETYLHRIGRTGRLGRTGTAITYVCRKDRKVAPALVKILKKTGEPIPGFLEVMARESGEAEV